MSSLWLVPHDNSPFTTTTQELISDTLPSDFPKVVEKHHFIPHVTLTSGIDPAKTYEATGTSAQEWLDSLTLPEFKKEANEVILELDHVEAGDEFFRKVVIEVNQDANLTKLAAVCRQYGVLSSSEVEQNGDAGGSAAEKWAKTEYAPHLSLMYADIAKEDVKKRLPLIDSQIGFGLGGLFACCGGTLCMGGNLVLVDTSKPIKEWKAIASRATPWVNWRMSRNLG